jgi:hypothetical protein
VKYNVYVDGSWLFRQCAAGGVLSRSTTNPNTYFGLDFRKLVSTIKASLVEVAGSKKLRPAGLYFYSAIFELPSSPNVELGDIAFLENNVYARRKFIEEATAGGFDCSGVHRVKLDKYILKKSRERTYREKMVDTSVVARFVEQAILYPERIHVLVTGDSDMLPAIELVSPAYTESVALVTTHPDQYDRSDGQTSFRLVEFPYVSEPLFLESCTHQLLVGNFVYRCSHCLKAFARERELARRENSVCAGCQEGRSGTREN